MRLNGAHTSCIHEQWYLDSTRVQAHSLLLSQREKGTLRKVVVFVKHEGHSGQQMSVYFSSYYSHLFLYSKKKMMASAIQRPAIIPETLQLNAKRKLNRKKD